MLIDPNWPIHSAIPHRVVSLILVCPLKCIKGYSVGVSGVKASTMVKTKADPIQPATPMGVAHTL